jgi:hypothetical protein
LCGARVTATSDLEVLRVSAHFRNDKPDGLGVALDFNDSGGVAFCLALEYGLAVYDRQQTTPEQILATLGKFARERPESHDAAAEVVMGVHWLQVRGHLAVDEYNGTLFCCVRGGNLLVVEDNPVAVDLDAATRSAVDLTDVVMASRVPALDPGLPSAIRAVVEHARASGK